MPSTTILLADDEIHWVDFVIDAVSTLGVECVHCSDVKDAMSYATKNSVSHIWINEGILENQYSELQDAIAIGYIDRVVVLSNRASLSQATEAFRHGLAYENKPYDRQQLIALLDRFPSSGFASSQNDTLHSTVSTIPVLVVEDRTEWTKVFNGVLSTMPRLDVMWATNYLDAKALIKEKHIEIAILDVRLADEDTNNIHGLVLLDDLRIQASQALVIVATGFSTIELAREAFFRYHVFDFFSKSPTSGVFPLDAFRQAVISAIRWSIARQTQTGLRIL